jgi:lipoprotein Spr
MLKKILTAFTFIGILAGCSSIKPLAFTNNRQASVSADDHNRKEVKFLDISSDNSDVVTAKEIKKDDHSSGIPKANAVKKSYSSKNSSEIEKAAPIQLKYAQLMNTEAEQVQNIPLYQTIDDWYGTRYKLGGNSKDGIDCSAFVQTIFVSVFGVTLPRTAREQYKATRRISRTELQEGDLLFFNTTGGVSHVGIYLQNNKFVHASVSGVTISDMFEPYYVKHFVSAGRVTGLNNNSAAVLKP